MEYTGASSFDAALRNMSSMMKRYSSVLPPCLATSSPAAFADPPKLQVSLEIHLDFAWNYHTRGYQVVYDDHGLTRLDGVRLHLKRILDQHVHDTETR